MPSVREYIENSLDLNVVNDMGQTALIVGKFNHNIKLHYTFFSNICIQAAILNRQVIIRELIAANVNMSVVDANGDTPLIVGK